MEIILQAVPVNKKWNYKIHLATCTTQSNSINYLMNKENKIHFYNADSKHIFLLSNNHATVLFKLWILITD